jgi:dCMP deaminase
VKWDNRFLQVARLVAGWSKDPSTRVGAVIVRNRKIVATGYNGFPPGIEDNNRLHDRKQKYPRIVHAEMNAILQAGHDCWGATLYLHFPHGGVPCSNCAKHIITAGITKVVFRKVPTSEWAEDQSLAEDMLRESGVETVRIP